MTKTFLLILLSNILFLNFSIAQNSFSEGRLTTNLTLTGDSTYYHVLPYKFEKGIGHVFVMRSKAFVPFIWLFDEKAQRFVGEPVQRRTGGEWECTIEITPERDSSLLVLLTSKEKLDTGYFTYGLVALTKEQINFTPTKSFCEKLGFFINHSSAGWRLINKRIDFIQNNKEVIQVKTNNYFDYALTPKGKVHIEPELYEEIVYSRSESLIKGIDTLLGDKVYVNLVKDITACLAPAEWMIETEKTGVDNRATYFYPKGSARKDVQGAMKIEYIAGNVVSPTEVKLFIY